MKKLVLALSSAVALVAACGSDPHAGEHCVKSHDETRYQNGICLMYSDGSGLGAGPINAGGHICILYQKIPYQATVCDRWAPDNPATVKAEQYAL